MCLFLIQNYKFSILIAPDNFDTFQTDPAPVFIDCSKCLHSPIHPVYGGVNIAEAARLLKVGMPAYGAKYLDNLFLKDASDR